MSPKILLNDNEIDLDLSDVASLSDLLKKISGEHLRDDEVLTSIHLNDEPLDDERFLSNKDKDISEISSLTLTTSTDPVDRASGLLGNMGDYLDGLSAGLKDVANVLRVGEVEKANSLLMQALDGISSFTELIGAVKTLAKSDLSEVVVEGENLDKMENRLLGILKNLKDGQESKDWVTVADLLEYELSPIMEKWRDAMPKLQEKIS